MDTKFWVGKNRITLSSGKYQVSFDRVIQSGRGILLGMMTEKLIKNKKQVRHTVKEFHDMLGHPNNHACHMTAKNLGYKLIGNMNSCEDCARGKQRKKNMNKVLNEKSNLRGERLYMDGSSIKMKSGGGSKFWYIFVDEATGLKQSIFTPTKSKLAISGPQFL